MVLVFMLNFSKRASMLFIFCYNNHMKQVLFATGNLRKIQEASKTLKMYNISVKPVSIKIDEIQHKESIEITKAKAIAAYKVTHKPVVVSDTSWEIPALGGLPGGYMKDIATWLESEDWLCIMSRHKDKTIKCHEHIAYFDGEELRHFSASYSGKFIDEIKGRIDSSESFERCVIMYGDKTMAEQSADSGVASAGEALDHWKQFGEWFGKI